MKKKQNIYIPNSEKNTRSVFFDTKAIDLIRKVQDDRVKYTKRNKK